MAITLVLSLLTMGIVSPPADAVTLTTARTGVTVPHLEIDFVRTSVDFDGALSVFDAAMFDALPPSMVEPEVIVAEEPGTPPDAEPIPYKPTPSHPDGPAIPLPRNDGSAVDVFITRIDELGAAPWEQNTFRCVVWFESKNNPWAVSPTNDRGLAQINGVHYAKYAGRDIFDPTVNAEVAWQVYQGAGWKAWTVAPLCGV